MKKKQTEPVKTGDWMYGRTVQKDPENYDTVTIIGPLEGGRYNVANWHSQILQVVKSEHLRMTSDEKDRLVKEANDAEERRHQAEYDARQKRLSTLRQALHDLLPKRYSADAECDIEESGKTWQDRVNVPIDVLEMFVGIQPGMKRKLK